MALHLDTLASFLPRFVVERLEAQTGGAERNVVDEHLAVVLFMDISGFTALTERLVRQGPGGVERVSRILNSSFQRWLEVVHEGGGDVIKFAGDALTALWLPEEGERGLTASLRRALSTALTLSRIPPDTAEAGEEVRLGVRLGLGAGGVHVGLLAGRHLQREVLLAGPAVRDAMRAEKLAQPGWVVVGPGVCEQAGAVLSGLPLEEGFFSLESIEHPESFAPLFPVRLAFRHEAALRAFLSPVVQARLDAGQEGWLGELRLVSVLFVNLPDLDISSDSALADTILEILGKVVVPLEGTVNKLSQDDKGVSALVAFGLPPYGTEDTAPRAIRASLQLQDALGAEGIRHAMGIASGRAYCGIIGAASRREYTLIGGVVNRAARLMQLAVEDIWCDGSTVEQAGDGVECEALPPVRLKGFAEPVPVFRPRTGHRQVEEPVVGQLFGHAAERERILEAFATLGEGEGGLLVMEAEAGMGKSVLARYALEEARARGFRTLHSEPDTLQRMMPYAVWTGIFRSLLGLSERDGLTAVSQRLFALPLRPLEWHAQRLPLLNPVLPTPMPETDFTRQLHPDVRAVNARAFLVEIFRLCTRSEPVVLVLEDAHWFDSASWALLRALADEGGPILILLSHRPFQGAPPEDYDALVSDGRAVVVRLGALAVEETGALLAARLGGAAPPLALVRRIWAWSQGNPFFAEELLRSLQERGVVRVRAGQCVVDDEVVDLPSIDLPATIEGVITSRIDRLPPEEQLTIKVASVIGRAFLLRLLCDIFPGEQRAASLRASVEALVAQGFVKVDAVTPEPTYSFKHVITREVAYGLMLYEQRQRLHRAVASRLEESHEDELRPWLAVLAHHWRHAGVAEKAVHYLSRAGEHAVESYSNQEAIRLLADARAVAEEGRVQVPAHVRARWDSLSGDAHLQLTAYSEAHSHYAQALQLLERPLPKGTLRLLAMVSGQVLRQVMHRLFPAIWVRWKGAARERAERMSGIYQRLAEIAYFDQDLVPLLHATFRNLNFAERSGQERELAPAYGTMAVTAGVCRLHPLARRYLRFSLEAAERSKHQPTLAYANLLSGVYHYSAGHWAEASEGLRRAQKLFAGLGDTVRWATAVATLGFQALFEGELSTARTRLQEVLGMLEAEQSVQLRVWGLAGWLWADLPRKVPGTGRVDELEGLLRQRLDPGTRVLGEGVAALVRLRRGEHAQARAHAESCARLLEGIPPSAPVAAIGAFGVVETCLALAAEGASDAPELTRRARRCCLALSLIGFQNLAAGPLSLLANGLVQKAQGRTRAARRWLRRCAAAARDRRTRYVEARAHLELALLPDASAAEHARLARSLLQPLDAPRELQRLPGQGS